MELTIDHVTRRFKDKTAVDDVTLCLTPGIWGLLGANGAGKTTLMRMLAGILEPTSGCIRYDGLPIAMLKERYRDLFGYLPQEFGFYPEFTVESYLRYMAALKGLPVRKTRERIDALLASLSLGDVRRKRIAKLSGGMRRRVGIAQALLNNPRVLILDEPTSGLDPGERIRFRNLLSELAADRIVVISTHIVPDVESIAGRNAIMKEGRLLSLGTTQALIRQVEGKVWHAVIPQQAVTQAEHDLRIVSLKNEADGLVSVRYLAGAPALPHSSAASPGLEDLYLWLFPRGTGEVV